MHRDLKVAQQGDQPPLIVSVVGWQDTGKTQLVSLMVAAFTELGYTVAAIKHDGHADKRQTDDWEKPNSDTQRFTAAGAKYTVIAGGGSSLVRFNRDVEQHSIESLCERLVAIARFQREKLDVIVVEGYKDSDLPKLVVVRTRRDEEWLDTSPVTNIAGVVCFNDCVSLAHLDYPVYHENDIIKLCMDLLDSLIEK
jgi:molybdopterin-guanine dinucleotide biosynthesis protein B